MKKLWIVWMLTLPAASGQDLPSDEVKGAEDTVATFSIVARDPATGELGLAVQSRAFRAGRTVPYGKPGVGMIASQAGAARTPYGRKGMEMLEAGVSGLPGHVFDLPRALVRDRRTITGIARRDIRVRAIGS